jgi:hypothetical protein
MPHLLLLNHRTSNDVLMLLLCLMLQICMLQFAPGPGPNAITVVNASSLSWNCLDCVMSSSRVAAPALPQPMPQFLELDAAAGSAPLVVQVYSCDSLKVRLAAIACVVALDARSRMAYNHALQCRQVWWFMTQHRFTLVLMLCYLILVW